MKRKSEAPEMYEDTIINKHGAPNKVISDNNAKELNSKFNSISHKHVIRSGNTIPHNQHQNYSEGEGDNFEFASCEPIHNAPAVHWCFAASFVDKVH